MNSNLKHYETVAVAGFGLTGVSVARFLLRQGVMPIVIDSRAEPPGLTLEPELVAQCECLFGEFSLESLLGLDLIIVSPGIDTRKGPLRMAADAGVMLISDIELFAWYVTAPVIAITGSNGKSTVTELAAYLLQQAGKKVAVGGNIGTPALDLLTTEHDCVVLELSSFQLELTFSLTLQAACILNISSDHLDRYDDSRAYIRAKHAVYTHSKHVVWNADDANTAPIQTNGEQKNKNTAATTVFGKASWKEGFGLQYDQQGHWLCWRGTRLANTAELPLVGTHNWLNVMAALALCRQLGLEPAVALQHIAGFKALPHRCELIGNYFNVRWIDDSKATNPGATAAAIEGLRPDVTAKLILIAGGDAKGADLTDLVNPLANVNLLITLGRDGPRIAALKEGAIEVKTMEEAVAVAKQHAKPGGAVLLSPACASLDMFSNYQERGMVFRKAVEVAHGRS